MGFPLFNMKFFNIFNYSEINIAAAAGSQDTQLQKMPLHNKIELSEKVTNPKVFFRSFFHLVRIYTFQVMILITMTLKSV